MGMFDYFRPKPVLGCPVCGASGLEWQGKNGPCPLFVWEQGQAAPVEQQVSDDAKLTPERRRAWRLPPRFEICAECQCSTFLTAVGITENGVWTKTELLNPTNALAYPTESESEFKKRLAAYARHLGHASL